MSGVASVDVVFRADEDGEIALNDHANEVYEPERLGHSGVSAWKKAPMTGRELPIGNHSGVDFPVLPLVMATEYYVHMDQFANNTLVDYYVQATDNAGNITKTNIFLIAIRLLAASA